MGKYPWQDINLNEENAAVKLLKLVGNKKTVLEVGCASGYVSKIMKEQLNCRVTGIEISAGEAEEAGRYCEKTIIGDIETLNMTAELKGQKFDVITFGDVLEHLINPVKVLKSIKAHLTEGGYVLASIPNIAHIAVALELLEGRFDYRESGILDRSHLRFFTKKSILALFREAGYEIIVWDRVIMRPEETEFKTTFSNYPSSLLSFLGSEGEALTYQFVVKAVPDDSSKDYGQRQKEWEEKILQELREKIAEKEKQLREKEKELKEKGAQLNAIQSSKCWRITAPLRLLKNFFKFSKRSSNENRTE